MPVERAGFADSRPFAPFIAQLIATQRQIPQTRAQRRGSQDDATTAYAFSPDRRVFRLARTTLRRA